MAWRKGSAGEKEAKEQKYILAFLAVVTIGVLLILFVIPNDVRTNVKASPVWMNIVGGILVTLSGASIVKAFKAMEEGVKSYIIAWAIALALGIFVAAGFFDYTY